MPKIFETGEVTGQYKRPEAPIEQLTSEAKKDFSGFNSCFKCGADGDVRKLETRDDGLFCRRCLHLDW